MWTAVVAGLVVFIGLAVLDTFLDQSLVRAARQLRATRADLKDDSRFSDLDWRPTSAYRLVWGRGPRLPDELRPSVLRLRAIEAGGLALLALVAVAGFSTGRPGDQARDAIVAFQLAVMIATALLWCLRAGAFPARSLGMVRRRELPAAFWALAAFYALLGVIFAFAAVYMSIPWPAP